MKSFKFFVFLGAASLMTVGAMVYPKTASALVKNYGPCQLLSAAWNRGTAAKGDIVTLRVNAKGECIGKTVAWDISATSLDPVAVNMLVSGAVTTWMPSVDGQYTFTASLTDGSGQIAVSSAMSVSGVNTQITYYIDPAGSNNNAGTSQTSAWSDFTNLASRTLQPGNRVLLKRGSAWNQQLTITGKGDGSNFIEIGAYGAGARPKICRSAAGANGQRSMRLQGASYVKVSSIEVCNGDAGIIIYYNKQYENRSVYFTDIVGHDFTGHYEGTGEVGYSYAIGFAGVVDWTPHVILSDFKVTDSEFYNNNVALWIAWPKDANGHTFFTGAFYNTLVQNVYIHDNNWTSGTYAGMTITLCTACQFRDLLLDKATYDAGSGTSSIFYGGSYHNTLDRVAIIRTPAPPIGPDGSAIDFESWTHGTVIENSWFEDNYMGAMEYFNNGGDSYNTQIKNNVFIDDVIGVYDWPGANDSYGNIFNNWYTGTLISISSPAKFYLCDNNAAYVLPLGYSTSPQPTACGSNTNIASVPTSGTFPTTNKAPIVTLTSPVDGSSFVANTSGTVSVPTSATASDPDGSVTKVEFALAGTYQTSYNYATAPGSQFFRWEMPPPCVVTAPPYNTNGCSSWNTLSKDRIDDANPEKLWVVAKATDNQGYTTTSWSAAFNILPFGSTVTPTLTPGPSPVPTTKQLISNWLTGTFDTDVDGKVNSLDFASLI